MKSMHNELARKRKSHIPEYREQVNSVFRQATKSSLPQYITRLHEVVTQAYKRSEIPKPDVETHFSQLTQVKDVSLSCIPCLYIYLYPITRSIVQ